MQALVWASGGIQLWAQTRGGTIMKNAAFWFGLVAVGILAGGLYVTQGLIWAVPVVIIGVIAFAAFRPRDAMPVALLLGSSLPIADLLRVWLIVRSIVADFDGPSILGKFQPWGSNGSLIISSDGQMSSDTFKFIFNFPQMLGFSSETMNILPRLTIAILLGAIVIAGISAFIRSRVAARNIISQN